MAGAVEAEMDAPLVDPNPRDVSARVVEGALALVRAELNLARSYARHAAKRAGTMLVLSWLAISVAQVAVVLLVLSPLLVTLRPWPLVVSVIVLALALAGAATFGALRALRSMRELGGEPPEQSRNALDPNALAQNGRS